MTAGVLADGQGRAEFPFPTPPASDDGHGHGKKAGDTRHGGGDSESDSCVGCRKIEQNEVWKLQRQKKSTSESHLFVSVRVRVRVSTSLACPPPSSSTQGKELLSELASTIPHGPQRELGDRLSLPRQVGIPLFVQVDAVCSNRSTKVPGVMLLDLTQHIVIIIRTLLFTFVTALNPRSHPHPRLRVQAVPSAIGIYPQFSSRRFTPAQSWPTALTCCGVIILPAMVPWSAGPGLIRLDLPYLILESSLLL